MRAHQAAVDATYEKSTEGGGGTSEEREAGSRNMITKGQ